MSPLDLKTKIFCLLRFTYKKTRYFGFKYKCPFCSSRLRKMLSFGFDFPVLVEKHVIGGGFRNNALCPVCGSIDRERLLYLYMKRNANILNQNIKILHVAPEQRLRAVLEKKENIEYITADLYSDNVMVKMDITDIRYPDDTFDVIICNHVLEHIIDDLSAMKELFRVLKSGGWALLQVPISTVLDETYEDFTITTDSGREQAFGQHDHVRIYAKDYIKRLEHAGFKVNQFKWWDDASLFPGKHNKYALLDNENLFIGVK